MSYICRAKRKDNGHWTFGYYVFDNEDLIAKDLRTVVRGVAEHVNVYPVHKETVERSVGRADKDGKPIFEGDIVKGYGVISYIVSYTITNKRGRSATITDAFTNVK